MTKFQFNPNGICKNPDHVTLHHEDNDHRLLILFAQAPKGRWAFGFVISLGNCGVSRFPSIARAIHTTYSDARDAAIACLQALCERHHQNPVFNAMSREVEAYRTECTLIPLFKT